MTQERGTEKIWLKDESGNYYMLTREMLEHAKVPESHKAEVEEIVQGRDDTVGYTTFATAQIGTFTLAGSQLSLVGRCACGRTFGVQTQFLR